MRVSMWCVGVVKDDCRESKELTTSQCNLWEGPIFNRLFSRFKKEFQEGIHPWNSFDFFSLHFGSSLKIDCRKSTYPYSANCFPLSIERRSAQVLLLRANTKGNMSSSVVPSHLEASQTTLEVQKFWRHPSSDTEKLYRNPPASQLYGICGCSSHYVGKLTFLSVNIR